MSNTLFHHGHLFDIVDHVPYGYQIWNIGKNMAPGYLPLCRLSQYQPFPGGRNIEVDTLKAIPCEGAQIILAAVGYGPDTIPTMEEYIKQHPNPKPYEEPAYSQVQKYKAALPYMRKLKWNT